MDRVYRRVALVLGELLGRGGGAAQRGQQRSAVVAPLSDAICEARSQNRRRFPSCAAEWSLPANENAPRSVWTIAVHA
jgi:hypothetical protein